MLRITIFLIMIICFTMCGKDIVQEKIVIDGDESDWADIPVLITDPDEQEGQYPEKQNVLWSDIVDIKEVKLFVDGTNAYYFIRFWGSPVWPNHAVSNKPEGSNSRGYYRILFDLDNEVSTGWNTEFYEGQKTILGDNDKNIGAELVIETGLDSDTEAMRGNRYKLYYSADLSERTYHLPKRNQWGRDIIIYEFPPHNDDSAIFKPQLISGKYSNPATDGEFAHAWGSDFVEVKQSLLPNIVYWQNKGLDYLKPGDTISIACQVETPMDNWGDDFTDGAEYMLPEYALEVGSISGTVKRAMDNTEFPGLLIEVHREGKTVGVATTDGQGHYGIALKPGEYTLKPGWGYVVELSDVTNLTIGPGEYTVVDFAVGKTKPPKILEQCAAAYKSLKGYKDTTTVWLQYIRPGMDSRYTTPLFFAFERPNRLVCETRWAAMMGGESSLYSDGENMMVYQKTVNQYTKNDAPDSITFDIIESSMRGIAENMLVQQLLMNENPLTELMRDVQGIKELGQEDLNGVATMVVDLTKPAGSFKQAVNHRDARKDMPVNVRLWIGKKDDLIRKVAYTLDLEKMADEAPPGIRTRYEGIKIAMTETHSAVSVEPDFPGDIFTFVPPRDATLVERIRQPWDRQEDLSSFEGKPAPAFVLKDINNKEVKLSDFKGKVCIVNFWATWCGPCRVEIPAFIALHSQYAKKGFTMIGISLDTGPEVVQSYAGKNEINYPMLMANDAVKENYGGISAVPTSFVLDRQSIIRYTYLGVPGDKLVFQRNVEELLAK